MQAVHKTKLLKKQLLILGNFIRSATFFKVVIFKGETW